MEYNDAIRYLMEGAYEEQAEKESSYDEEYEKDYEELTGLEADLKVFEEKIKDFSKIPRVHNIKKTDLPSRSHGNVSSEKTETKRQGIKVGFCCFCAAEVFLTFFAHTA